RAVPRDRAGRGPRRIRRPPALPPGALALALPSDPPLGGSDGLAGGLAAAPAGHRAHARAVVRAPLHPWVRGARALCLSRVRLVSRGLHPRERAVPSARGGVAAGHAP